MNTHEYLYWVWVLVQLSVLVKRDQTEIIATGTPKVDVHQFLSSFVRNEEIA